MDFKKYEAGNRPNKLHYTKYYVYDKGEALGVFSWDEQEKKAKLMTQKPTAVVQKVFDSDKYNVACSEYRARAVALRKQFWRDLADDLSLRVSVDHPRFKAFKNYLETRFDSFEEIAREAEDLAELLG